MAASLAVMFLLTPSSLAIGSGEPDFRFRQIRISAFLFDSHNIHVLHHDKLCKDTAGYHD